MSGGQQELIPFATLFCLVGVALNAWAACALFEPGAWRGNNDFLGLYAGARLVGTSNLYDRDAVRETQERSAGITGDSLRFSRLPYYALLLKPLAWLPYRVAYAFWVALSSLALVSFAAMWPGNRSRWVVCCWFLPAFVAVFNGQDAEWLLVWAALAVSLTQRDRQFAAGMVLALCASKYHLAIMIPLVIIAQRRWRMTAGFAIAGTAMLAVSFLVAGPRWPIEYFAVATDPRIHPGLVHMASLHGAGLPVPLEILTVAAVAMGVVVTARNASFALGMAIALAAGVLVGFHAYLSDCVLLLPAILQALQQRQLRFLGLVLATPAPWFLLQFRAPVPNVTRGLILLLLVGSALRPAAK